MNGDEELRQLAHLLRVGANTARDIASIRKMGQAEICALAAQAEAIAGELERIARHEKHLPT